MDIRSADAEKNIVHNNVQRKNEDCTFRSVSSGFVRLNNRTEAEAIAALGGPSVRVPKVSVLQPAEQPAEQPTEQPAPSWDAGDAGPVAVAALHQASPTRRREAAGAAAASSRARNVAFLRALRRW